MNGSPVKAGGGGEGIAGRRAAQGTGTGEPPPQPFRQPAIPPETEREMQRRAQRQIIGESARLAERTGRWRRGSAGCGRRRGRWPAGHTGSSQTPRGTPPRGCEGTVAVREEGRRGGKRGWARAGKAVPGGRAGSRVSSGGRTAHQLQPKADADGLGLGVATSAAVCAAAGAQGAGDSPGPEGGGSGGAGLLREVGREDERRAEEARDPPFLRPCRQGGGVTGKGGKMEESRWRRMLGEALPGMNLDCPQKYGKQPRVRMLRDLLQREGWY